MGKRKQKKPPNGVPQQRGVSGAQIIQMARQVCAHEVMARVGISAERTPPLDNGRPNWPAIAASMAWGVLTQTGTSMLMGMTFELNEDVTDDDGNVVEKRVVTVALGDNPMELRSVVAADDIVSSMPAPEDESLAPTHYMILHVPLRIVDRERTGTDDLVKPSSGLILPGGGT